MNTSHDEDAQKTPSKRKNAQHYTPPAAPEASSPGCVVPGECNGHYGLPGSQLLKSFTSSRPVECDGCGGNFIAGSEFFGCRSCNFDLCKDCYSDAAGVSGLASVSVDASSATSESNLTERKDALAQATRGKCINNSLLEETDAPQLAVLALRSWMHTTPLLNSSTKSAGPRALYMGISRLNKHMVDDKEFPDSDSTLDGQAWREGLHRAFLAETLSDLCSRWPEYDRLLEVALDALTLLAKEEAVLEEMAAHAASYLQDTDQQKSSNTSNSNSSSSGEGPSSGAVDKPYTGAPAVLKLGLKRAEKANAEWRFKIYASSFSLVGEMVLSEDGVGGRALISLCPVISAFKEVLVECAAATRDQTEIEEMVRHCGNAIYNLGHSGTDGVHAKLLSEGGIVEAALDVCRAMPISGVVHRWALGSVEAIIRFHDPAREIALLCGVEKVAKYAASKAKFKKDGPSAKFFAANCLKLVKAKRAELEKQEPCTESPTREASEARSPDAEEVEEVVVGADTKRSSPRFSTRRSKITMDVAMPIRDLDEVSEMVASVTKSRKTSTSLQQTGSATRNVSFDTDAPKPPPGALQPFSLGFRGATGQLPSSSGSRAHSEVSVSATSYFESRSNHGRPSSQASVKRPRKHVSQRLGDRKLLKLGVRSTATKSGAAVAEDDEEVSAEHAEEEEEAEEEDEDSSQHPSKQKRAARGAPPLLVYPARGEKLLPLPKQAPHMASVKQLFETHKQRFGEWQSLLLRGGFNLLLYGFGSKHALLTAFREEMMRSTLMVEAKGWEATTSSETVRKQYDSRMPS